MLTWALLCRALIKANESALRVGSPAVSSMEPSSLGPLETIRSVIESIRSAALDVQQAGGPRAGNEGVAPCGAVAAYYGALLLISHGDGALGDMEWLFKVGDLKRMLEILSMRWKIAGERAQCSFGVA